MKTLEICAVLLASNFLKILVLFYLEKSVVMFGSNSLTVAVIYDLTSEKGCSIIWYYFPEMVNIV